MLCPCPNETQHCLRVGFTVEGLGHYLDYLSCLRLVVPALPCCYLSLLFNLSFSGGVRTSIDQHLAQLELAGSRVQNPTTLRSGRLKSLDWPVCLAVKLYRKSLPVPPHSYTALMHHHSLSRECQKSAEGVKRCSTWGVVSRASIDSASSGSCSPGLPPLPLHSVKRCHISRPRRKSQ